MDLIDFYKSALDAASIRVSQADELSFSMSGAEIPFTLNDQRVVLPTTQHLSDKKGKVLFHPLKETVLSTESTVVSQYRKSANIKMQISLCTLISEILTLGTSPAEHSKCSISMAPILVAVKDADETTRERWLKIVQAISKSIAANEVKERIIHVFLKRKGMIGEKHYSRVGSVSFPLYEQLLADEKTVFGVALRKKDREVLRQVMRLIFPEIEIAGAYNYGTNSDIGPYFDAMLGTIIRVAKRINEIAELMGEFLTDRESVVYDLSFACEQEIGYTNMKGQITSGDTPAQVAKPLSAEQARQQREQFDLSAGTTSPVQTAQKAPTPVAAAIAQVTAQSLQPNVATRKEEPVTTAPKTRTMREIMEAERAAPVGYSGQMMGGGPQAAPGYTVVIDPQTGHYVSVPVDPRAAAWGVPPTPASVMLPNQQQQQPMQYPAGVNPGVPVSTRPGAAFVPPPARPVYAPPQCVGYNQFGQPVDQYGQVMGPPPAPQIQAAPVYGYPQGMPAPGYGYPQAPQSPQQGWNGSLPAPVQQRAPYVGRFS